ncbi:MAG: lamin tail domain-containing protein [Chthoniobacterales bacterium]
MKSRNIFAIALLAAATFSAGPRAQAQLSSLRITEVMSSSGVGGTVDWFEVSNFDLTNSVDLTGWKMDDSSFSFAVSVALNGVTSIAGGQTAVFLETANPGTDIPAFRTFWGSAAASIVIGSYTGSGVGLSSTADGLVLFDSLGVEKTPRASFGLATTGSSFFYGYNRAGGFDTYGSSSNGVISTVGTIAGTDFDQLAYTSSNALGNIGSPGTAINAVPEPSTYAMLALAGVGLAAYRFRRRARP